MYHYTVRQKTNKEYDMKRCKVFFWGMTALALSFGVLTGCDLEDLFNKDDDSKNESGDNKTNGDNESDTNNDSGGSKTVTLTGLSGDISIHLCPTIDPKNENDSVALSAGSSGTSLTLYDTASTLADMEGKGNMNDEEFMEWLEDHGTPWTGSGSYYVVISEYKNQNEASISISNEKISFANASTTIAYSTSAFKEFDSGVAAEE
jgi:hypothetical protein